MHLILAKEHGIPVKNRGQIAKEFAEEREMAFRQQKRGGL